MARDIKRKKMKTPNAFKSMVGDILQRHGIGRQVNDAFFLSKIQEKTNFLNKKLPIEITSLNKGVLKVTISHPSMKNYAKNLIEGIIKEGEMFEIKEIIIRVGDFRQDKLYS
jgi:D-ribose pyranose/furanose isomerase RbsD